MRLVLSGNTQNLYDLVIGIDARWPHPNVDQLNINFPDGSVEAGNASASVKIGASTINGANNVGVDRVLVEDQDKFYPSRGASLNGHSLKSIWVRGSANNTILYLEMTTA